MGGLPREPAHQRSGLDRKSTRLNSSHQIISYAVFCLKKKKIYLTIMCQSNTDTPTNQIHKRHAQSTQTRGLDWFISKRCRYNPYSLDWKVCLPTTLSL